MPNCEHNFQFEAEVAGPTYTERTHRCVLCGKVDYRRVATMYPVGVTPPTHEFKTLTIHEVEIRTYTASAEVIVRHLPTGVVVKCKETNNPTLNKNAALSYLAEQVQSHYKEKAMPKVEKAYDKIVLTSQDVEEALKQYILKTTKRTVRGSIHVSTNGSGINTTAYALLEDQPLDGNAFSQAS